jgi:hypothetical protein
MKLGAIAPRTQKPRNPNADHALPHEPNKGAQRLGNLRPQLRKHSKLQNGE